MKRLRTFDIMRGIAILVVVLGHRIYWDYYRQNAGALNTINPALVIFTMVLTMAGIFFCISGAVNTYVNFSRLKEGKLSPKQVLIKSLITGFMLIIISVFFRYLLLRTTDDLVSIIQGTTMIQWWNETGVVPYAILYGVYPIKFNFIILFYMGTLSMIGYSIISVSIILVLYHKYKGLENTKSLRRLFLILGIVIFLTSALTYQFLWGPVKSACDSGNIVVAIFAAPLVYAKFSVFPYLAFGFFGAFFGVGFADKNIEPKKVLRQMLLFWTILLGLGIIVLGICISIGLNDPSIFGSWYYAWGQMFLQLGMYFLLFWLGMKFIDYQPEEKIQKRMKWFNWLDIIGKVTFTVFIFEGVLAVSLQRIFAPIWPNWNATFGNITLFGLLNLAVWIVIILIWKQFKYIGSVEWTTTWLIQKISGQKSSKMDHIKSETVVDS